jgi:hypothetical protein
VRAGRILRCDDTETDPRVDRESCRALSIRSMLAAPVRKGPEVTGLIEVFSAQPATFNENDSAILQRLAETILAAMNRTSRSPGKDSTAAHVPSSPTGPAFVPSGGSILFASEGTREGKKKDASDPDSEDSGSAGIRLPRSLLILLICAAAAISLALGFVFAPRVFPSSFWQRIHTHTLQPEQTVLASSSAQPPNVAQASPSIETATLDQLKHLAAQGDAAAENALGLRYATGDGVKEDEKEAARWFANAAEHGNVAAQSKLGQLYWSGRGVPVNVNQAYFWTVLARAAGHQGSKALAPLIGSRMTPAQAKSIEQEADSWYRQHESSTKPSAGR